MSEKKSFILYADMQEAVELLTDEQAGKLFKGLLKYAHGESVDFEEIPVKMLFQFIKAQIDRDFEKWEKAVEQRRNAVNARWNKVRQEKSESEEIRSDTTVYDRIRSDTVNVNDNVNVNVNVNDNVNDNVNVNVIKERECASAHTHAPKTDKFSPPSVEEVTEFCRERGNRIDPEAFVTYYENNGWKVGRNKMKNWKLAVISWEKNGIDDTKRKKSGNTTPFNGNQSSFSVEDIEKSACSRYRKG